MILKDYQCQVCEEITECYVDGKNIPDQTICPICNGYAKKIVSMSQTNPVDSAWIASVLEVVEKGSDKPHCNEFLKHPTRANYKAWMKGEGVRHIEDGEKPNKRKPDPAKKEKMKKAMLNRYLERNAVSI